MLDEAGRQAGLGREFRSDMSSAGYCLHRHVSFIFIYVQHPPHFRAAIQSNASSIRNSISNVMHHNLLIYLTLVLLRCIQQPCSYNVYVTGLLQELKDLMRPATVKVVYSHAMLFRPRLRYYKRSFYSFNPKILIL